MAHHQRDLINKDEVPDRLKIPVHGPPSSVASAGLPSPLALPPPAVGAACSTVTASPRAANTCSPFIHHLPDVPAPVDPSPAPAPLAVFSPSSSQAPSRCATCRKKVGLAGFRCRCDGLFCGVHRYSDRHACTFDYKAQGREAIARENPVYKAPKLLRI